MPMSDSKSPALVRTCQNCSRAKIRCVTPQGKVDCERCERLGKDCYFRPVRIKHNGMRRERRIDVLESRVEQLLADSNRSSSQPGPDSSRNDSDVVVVSAVSSPPNRKVDPQYGDVVDQGILTMEAANALVESFKKTMMSHLPFVVFPDGMTGEKLRREKPFVFLTTLTAALYDNMPMQRTLSEIVKKIISHRMIFGGEISFELLQGLLIYIAWCQYHPRPRRFSQYLQLMISIIVDLRLDMPRDLQAWNTRVGADPEDETPSTTWGREEQRAVVGCCYLSSSVSPILQKLCTFPSAPFIKWYCESLAKDPEYPSDSHLTHAMDLQSIFERIHNLPVQNTSGFNTMYPELEAHIQSLEHEVEVYRATLPFPLQDNHSLLIQFHTVKLYLCQLSLFDRSRNRTHPWTQFQLRSLCCGLVEAKTLLNFYTSLPLRAEMTFINSQWIQIGFALTFTSKLAVTSLENSIYHQTAEYRDSLDMSSILRKVILRIQALTTPHIDSRGDRDVFYHYEKRLKHLQWWYESNASKPLPASSRLSVTPVPESSTGFFNIPSTVGIESSQDNMSWPPFAAEGVDDMLADWIPDPSAAFDSFW